MFRRRRRQEQEAGDQPSEAGSAAVEQDADSTEAGDERVAAEQPPDRSNGPFDSSEVDLEEARQNRIDLGGLLVRAVQGMKLQLQVDKRSGRATSAILGLDDAAVQLVAVAAPRSSGLWEQTRLEISTSAQRRGGSVQEGPGPFGTEVRMVLPVKTKDGREGRQPSRVSGIDGPRWMLRATFLGKAITDAAALQKMVALVRQVVVVRGDAPMPPGEVIPLRPPAQNEPGQEATVAETAETGELPAGVPADDAGAAGGDTNGDPDGAESTR
ncbi:DUF3710 domain-containing protein [Phytoactinopolyspora halotolerans]|uniref:DUF3710 domain-containing protein n=1 Tax=Phytoactinopolyspora halotolerans TaxID=1981512 RepID=A0A6L9SBN3_9ACTN|nr:DUF3710 domain-containing protein [Phytoactinopolyspora halotolerans]NEE01420.1 DUF3710 domain-containing protein [Phytoactinopolyspora halotolerans]